MIQLTDKLWAVEVPADAHSIEICNYGLNETLEYAYRIHGVSAYNVDDLPPGSWQYLFITKGATEEDLKALDIVPKPHRGDCEFSEKMNGTSDCYFCAFQFMLRSKGCDVNKNLAILQKQTTNEQ